VLILMTPVAGHASTSAPRPSSLLPIRDYMGSKGGFTPSAAPTGWEFLDCHRTVGFTMRWKRGDRVAYVRSGQR
jgi:hypothetical protein